MYNTKNTPIQKLIIILNETKFKARQQVPTLQKLLAQFGIQTSTYTLYQLASIPFDTCDAIMSVGGDGTILSLAPYALRHQKPIIGINCGHLGFLTMYSIQALSEHLPNLVKCDYQPSSRHLLKAVTGDQSVLFALNDIVLKSRALRLVNLEIELPSGLLVTRTRSDGMIFCTSTGSTAYNLSAHGPVLHPSSSTWCMTPICPHDFFNRTLVFDNSIQLVIHSKDNVEVVRDGRKYPSPLLPLTIGIAEETVSFVQPNDFSYFDNLRTKFNW